MVCCAAAVFADSPGRFCSPASSLPRAAPSPPPELSFHMAVGQNQWYHFGVGAPPMLVYFSRDWDVHWGYGILNHGRMLAGIG